jgi:hypothetical protein
LRYSRATSRRQCSQQTRRDRTKKSAISPIRMKKRTVSSGRTCTARRCIPAS